MSKLKKELVEFRGLTAKMHSCEVEIKQITAEIENHNKEREVLSIKVKELTKPLEERGRVLEEERERTYQGYSVARDEVMKYVFRLFETIIEDVDR